MTSIFAGLIAAALAVFGLHLPNTYTDPAHRFSFDVPASEHVGDYPAQSGVDETLIISGSPRNDEQIVITPWTGDAGLANLETQYPYIGDPPDQGVLISTTTFAGVSGITFSSNYYGTQIWIVQSGYLYIFEDVPSIVLSSWRF